MKRLFAILMVALTALSVGGVILYSIHKTMATGGQSPVISFAQETIDVDTAAGEEVLLEGVTATDAEDGDVTDSVMVEHISQFVEKDTVEVTYVAFDSQNHVSRATRQVHYTNYHAPQFSLDGPMVFVSKTVNDMMDVVSAKDVVDGDISVKIHASFEDSSSALSAVGEHEIEFSVTNSLGDTARLKVPVRVVEDAAHSDSIPLKTYLVYLKQGAEFNASSYLMEEQQENNNNNNSRGDERNLSIQSNVNTAAPGVYAVDYSIFRDEITVATTRLIVVVQ